MRGLDFADHVGQDLRYAVRTLLKTPVFTAVAILSLALGIGANTAIFSVMDVLSSRPLPVRDPLRLALVNLSGKTGPRYSLTYPMLRDDFWIATRSSHTRSPGSTKQLQTPVGDDMTHISGVLASGDYFGGLGIDPILGRVFGREDDQPAGGRNGPVVVIGERLWERRYGRRPSAMASRLS